MDKKSPRGVRYDESLRKEIVAYAKEHGHRQAAEKYNVGRSSVWQWVSKSSGKSPKKKMTKKLSIRHAAPVETTAEALPVADVGTADDIALLKAENKMLRAVVKAAVNI